MITLQTKFGDLEFDGNIAIQKNNESFADLDIRNSDFSLSIDILMTDKNRQILRNINVLDSSDRKKLNQFEVSVYYKNSIVIEGIFKIRQISKNKITGNITQKNVQLAIDNKLTLRDLQYYSRWLDYKVGGPILDERYFEYPFNYFGDIRVNLFQSNVQPHTINDTKSNIYNKINRSEITVTSFDYYLSYIDIIKKIFLDAGYEAKINFVDDNLNAFLMYTDTESTGPINNWGYIYDIKLKTRKDRFQASSTHTGANGNTLSGEWNITPFISGRYSSNNMYNFDINYKFNTAQGLPPATQSSNSNFVWSQDVDTGDFKMHFIPINFIYQDGWNSFNSINTGPYALDNAQRGIGEEFIAEVDGEFEFDMEVSHLILQQFHINYFPSNPNNEDLSYLDQDANKGWQNYIGFKSKEKHLLGNAVMLVKNLTDPTTLLSDYKSSVYNQNLTVQQTSVIDTDDFTSYERLRSAKVIQNFDNDNVIAYYNPMIRDLVAEGLTFEETFEQKKALKANPTFGKGAGYQGFNIDNSEVLLFENDITNNLNTPNRTEQRKNKFVQLGAKHPDYAKVQMADGQTISRNAASGTVKFKVKTTLKKGDRVRLVYVTANEYKLLGDVNNFFNSTINNYMYNSNQNYDWVTDSVDVKKFNIKMVKPDKFQKKSGNYYYEWDLLKYSSFLPNINQSDFIKDFIKTFDLFYTINDKTITFFKRDQFFNQNSNIDITPKVDVNNYVIEQVEYPSKIQYGLKRDGEDDNYNKLSVESEYITTESELQTDDVTDITSALFYKGYTEEITLIEREIAFNNKYYLTNNTVSERKIKQLRTYTKNESAIAKNDVNLPFSYNKKNRLYKAFDPTGLEDLKKFLVNGVPKNTLICINEGIQNLNISTSFLQIIENEDVSFELKMDFETYLSLNIKNAVIIDNQKYFITKINNYIVGQTKMIEINCKKI